MPSVLELYEKLKPKLGEQETRSLLEYVESTVEQRAATKADLERNTGELREEIRRVEGELREEIRRVEGELREEIRRVEGELREAIRRGEGALREEMHSMRADLFKEMHSMKADLIKWSFVFWMGAVVALSGVAFTLLRLFGPR
jgi:predicted RNase H-like nuclease (RuvC/YqgF family)